MYSVKVISKEIITPGNVFFPGKQVLLSEISTSEILLQIERIKVLSCSIRFNYLSGFLLFAIHTSKISTEL